MFHDAPEPRGTKGALPDSGDLIEFHIIARMETLVDFL
jgi:hypothetical protein